MEELLDWKGFCYPKIKDLGVQKGYSPKYYLALREGGGYQTAAITLEISNSSKKGRSAESIESGCVAQGSPM